MPKKPTDMEREILADGWQFKNQQGSHRHYIHPTKPGKVTIPFQTKTLHEKQKTVFASRQEYNIRTLFL